MIVLLGILFLICFQNYTPGTWLVGWDNIMPELNIWLNLKRSLFAVWQEYQGLGLVGGMGHATDLIREIFLLPFTFILPASFVRYFWHFLLLFLGTFGIYFGLNKRFSKTITILALLFYLLNFGSIQYFWAPLESFSAFWGFFPWLIFLLWDYLKKPSKNNLIKLLVINLLAIPAFYVQTIFIVYLICVSLILFSHFLYHRSLHSLKFYGSIALKIFLINSFWLLPFIYFLITNLHSPVAGIGNFMSSEESFARNLYRGTIPDFLLLRGYYIDFPDTGGSFMAPWAAHFSNLYVLICGYLISSLVIIGLIYLIKNLKKLKPEDISVLLIFLLSCVALLSATPPFSQINSLIRQSNLLNQVFRAPFTKFIVPTIFSFTLLTAYGLQALTHLNTKLKYSNKTFSFLLFTFYFLFLITFSFPVFTGNYVSPNMRQNIPPEYFQLFNYLDTQSPTARIANLPSGSFWGWTNYNFGIRGSGFIWYGIEQPILDRAFDTWNLKNEQYYWELNYALQKQDPLLLENILKKYSIEFVMFDNNVYFPQEIIYSKNILSTKNLLPQVSELTLVKKFGQISLYKYQNPSNPYILSQPTTIAPTDFYLFDSGYLDHQDYISSPNASIIYPYQNLFTNRLQSEFKFNPNLINTSTVVNWSNHSELISPEQKLSNGIFEFIDRHSSHLFAFNFSNANLDQAYLLEIVYRHTSGLPLTISANSNNLKYKYFDTRLNSNSDWQTAHFVLPAYESGQFNKGLTVIFNNSSPNQFSTINQIKSVKMFTIPLKALIKSSNGGSTIPSTRLDYPKSSSRIFYHTVSLTTANAQYLVLPQSFSSGWLAFYFDGIKPVFLNNHVLVNNWANGWSLNTIYQSPYTIYILFWPQLLEFAGLFLLIGTFIWIFKRH